MHTFTTLERWTQSPFSRIAAALLFFFLSSVLFFSFSALPTQAATRTFASTEATNDFNLAANWGILPTDADIAVVPAGTSTSLTGNITIGQLSASGTVNVLGRTLTVNGATYVDNLGVVTSTNGIITLIGAVSSTGAIGTVSGQIAFGSTFRNEDTFNIAAGTVTTTVGALTNTAGATINVDTGTLSLAGDLANSGTINVTAGTGTLRLVGGATQSIAPGTTLFFHLQNMKTGSSVATITASSTFLGNFTSTGAGTVAASGANALTIVGTTTMDAGGVVTSTSGVLTFTGNVSSTGAIGSATGNILFGGTYVNNGTLAVGAAGFATTTGNVTSTAGSTINLNTGTLAVLADLDLTASTFNRGTGTVRFANNAAQDVRPSTNATANSTYFNNIESIKGGGSVLFSNSANSSTVLGYFTASGTAMVTYNAQALNFSVVGNSSFNQNSTVTSTAGSLSFGAVSSTGLLGTVSGNMSFASTLQNNGTLNIGGIATTTGVLTNVGTVNQNAGTLVIVGGLTQSGTFNPQTGTTIYHGTALAVAEQLYRNLRIRGTATLGDASASTTVGGTLNIDGNGTLTLTNTGSSLEASHLVLVGVGSNAGTLTMTAGGSFGPTVTSTAAFTNTGTVNAAGLLDFNSSFTNSGTFNGGASTVRYSGTSASNIGAGVFYNINLTGGATYTVTASTTAMATTTIQAGSTLSLGSQSYTGYGDITNLGTVTTSTGNFLHPLDYVRITDEVGSILTTTNDAGYIDVRLKDQNRNLNGAAIETIIIPVSVNAAGGGDAETMTLTETTASSGIFHNLVHMNVRGATISAGNERIDLTADGTGTVSYVDTFGTDTGTVTIALTLIPRSSSGGGGGGAVSSGGGGGGGSSSNVPVVVSNPAVVPPVLIPPPSTTFPVRFPVTPTVGTPTTLVIPHASVTLRAFLDNGGTPASRALGSGERGAILRDLQETTGRVAAAIPVDDLERVANGQIPRTRNLAYERSMVPRALQTFRTIFGHAPNFKIPAENLAWNTLMYRIRFQRNLSAEQGGIRAFRSTFRLTPSTPFQWATVRVMGYIAR